jgi:acarbose 7IV-phosphotransferase
MSAILVSGLINIETTLQVDGFPVHYQPVRYPFFGVNTTVSGVGYNVAKALATLGSTVRFLSLTGKDAAGELVRSALREDDLPAHGVLPHLDRTAQSVILYDGEGRRMISTDLKDIQEQQYPQELFEQALAGADLAVLCNINFSRAMLGRARQAGIPIATDVHTLSDLEDDYNRDFLAAATSLFMSDEGLPCAPESWVRRIWERWDAPITVIGLGAQGALLAVRQDNFLERIPAVRTRPVVSTIGAGDALFSSFIHFYHQTGDPYTAIRRAVFFASYKIGEAGAAQGFLTESQLEQLVLQSHPQVQ